MSPPGIAAGWLAICSRPRLMMKCAILVVLVLSCASLAVCQRNIPGRAPGLELFDVDEVLAHLEALQTIASANGDTRAAGTSGYDASVDYVVATLEKETNYTITVQPFSFDKVVELAPPEFSQTSPSSEDYQEGVDFRLMSGSGSGDVTASLSFQNLGCDSSDFSGFTSGDIALVERGDCDFSEKVDNAVTAGAVGVLIYNYEGEGAFSGTLGSAKSVPAFGLSNSVGRSLAESTTAPTVRMYANTQVQTVNTSNVIAETTGGASDSIIVVGSHLDSVPAGPGINDNGSGSASNLEMARQFMAVNAPNKIRFCWWGAEEEGLLGSEFYVNSVIESGDISNIVLNLNYDMIGSPNYFRGIYDGEGASIDIRAGSVAISQLYQEYFNFNELAWALTPFDGRSDYGPFIANGVPAGGLFTGAEVVKTAEERMVFGGLALASYDTCYHQHCDSIYNIDEACLDEMGKAGYFVLLELATNSDLSGLMGGGSPKPEHVEPMNLPYKGNDLVR